MSEHHLAVSPLVRQAARNLRTVEWLSENNTWSSNPSYRWNFWRTRRMMTMTPDEAAAWLPAVAVAVQWDAQTVVFEELTHWPIPEPLPPEAIPWRDALIQSWEQHPAATGWNNFFRLAALVRLDRRVERLPEWLREPRRALNLEWYNRNLRLAALAGWRPRPGDAPPHMGSAGVAQAWVRFWEESYKSPDIDDLIAATALLHLAEAGWLPSGLSPGRLRAEFPQRLRQRMRQYDIPYGDRSVLRMLLFSIPADVSTPERWRRDVTEWLKLTGKDVEWEKREAVWEMLAAWQREGILERCGISLVPDLARTLEWERHDYVLRAMAGYIPGAVEVSAHPEAARAVVARWEALSRGAFFGEVRQAAWVARWNLMRAGVLTAGEQARFTADYVDAIRSEKERAVLLALAQTRPPGSFPLDDWKRRLSDRNNECRLAAGLAIHGWLVDMASGGQRRQMRQALRRAGQEVTGTVAPFVNIPREMLPDFRRLREIETALAAGQMSPPPDAAAKNRATPRAVLARLPEAHPRTGPPGITDRTTGRTAGSEPPARHPFPEVIRHE